jgi:formylglycine-generating enzyme required for sulfatase activity
VSEWGIGATTPVGTYPKGTSPFGAQDMVGNVWEWTSSLYKPYPYRANDGRERVDATGDRVLRGGSWGSLARDVCAAYRVTGASDDLLGFRLACVAAGS